MDKKAYLNLARKSISSILTNKELKRDDFTKSLNEIGACFVTLHSNNGDLRGCIGNIIAFEPLVENIINNAINAAFKDSRFPSVLSMEELNSLQIEISILTSPQEINTIDEIIIGKHGIILEKNQYKSVFLPQVALEQGWNIETTLTHLSMKAGLPNNAWKENDCIFKVFEAIVFSE